MKTVKSVRNNFRLSTFAIAKTLAAVVGTTLASASALAFPACVNQGGVTICSDNGVTTVCSQSGSTGICTDSKGNTNVATNYGDKTVITGSGGTRVVPTPGAQTPSYPTGGYQQPDGPRGGWDQNRGGGDYRHGDGGYNRGDWGRNHDRPGYGYPDPTPSYPEPTPSYPDPTPSYPDTTPSYPDTTPTPTLPALCVGTFSGKFKSGEKVAIEISEYGNMELRARGQSYPVTGSCDLISRSKAQFEFTLDDDSAYKFQGTITKEKDGSKTLTAKELKNGRAIDKVALKARN